LNILGTHIEALVSSSQNWGVTSWHRMEDDLRRLRLVIR
jgi:hypothetical protein